MNRKIPEIHQKQSISVDEKKKISHEFEAWIIEEYYVPYQAS